MYALRLLALVFQATTPPPPDKWFKGYVIFTAIIAALNLGVLIAIWLQRNVMREQLCEMRLAREQTDKLIQRASDQVVEMKNAGAQTDQLIIQARQQVTALTIAADAAAKSAKAAEASATVLMNSERAWIMIKIDWAQGALKLVHTSGSGQPDGTAVNLLLSCVNQGRTSAWISRRRIRLAIVDEVDHQPDFGIIEAFQYDPVQLGPGEPLTTPVSLQCEGRSELGKLTLVYGMVEYRDIFGSERQITFGYTVTPANKFERISLAAYNRNT